MSTNVLAVDGSAIAALRERLDAFVRGDAELSGLDLYYVLEGATPLVSFHTMLRGGPQNQTRSGLQQSYGDHNRLLLLGLDKLIEGDLAWYRSRLVPAGDVPDAAITRCFDVVHGLGLDPRAKIALWLGAALHDCGMLGGHSSDVDVEDGVVYAADILAALCPPDLLDLATFAIRNHDYIKDVFSGETPVAFLTDQLARLAPGLRTTAQIVLGMIQVAGAASLGEGRLTAFRLSIFDRCADGSAFADASASGRLARLLDHRSEVTDAPTSTMADAVLDALDDTRREPIERFLVHVPIHGWRRSWAGRDEGASTAAKAEVLVDLVAMWADSGADHVVLIPDDGRAEGVDGSLSSPAGSTERLANGTVALILRPRELLQAKERTSG